MMDALDIAAIVAAVAMTLCTVIGCVALWLLNTAENNRARCAPRGPRLVTDRGLEQTARALHRAGAVSATEWNQWTEDWMRGLAREGYDQEQILSIAAGAFLRTLEIAREHRAKARDGVRASNLTFWGDAG